MLDTIEIAPEANADEWAIRSEFWIVESEKSKRKRLRRERNSNALILTGHGTRMRIENGALVIREGFTHYPQEQVCHRFFRGDLNLPPRILLLDGSGTLTFDVLSWLAEQDVPLARVTWDGEVSNIVSAAGSIQDPAKVDWQRTASRDERLRLAFVADLLARKFEHSCETLLSMFPPSPERDRAIQKAKEGVSRLRTESFQDMNAVRALEGAVASAYFRVWFGLTLQWTGTKRLPIPEAWQSYSSRSSVLTGHKKKNRKASHPLNAMLNYAYAVRQSELQIQAVADGYDPRIGIMHHQTDDRAAFILDLIEPERPKVDSVILGVAQSRKFTGADFVIRADGACRLSPQLARALALLVRS